MCRHIAKIVQLGSNIDQCYIKSGVVMDRVIKRCRCNSLSPPLKHKVCTGYIQKRTIFFLSDIFPV